MTFIALNAPTKKALRERLEATPETVNFSDPSFVNPFNKGMPFSALDLPEGYEFVCTNHPKRSWFAQVRRNRDGSFRVA